MSRISFRRPLGGGSVIPPKAWQGAVVIASAVVCACARVPASDAAGTSSSTPSATASAIASATGPAHVEEASVIAPVASTPIVDAAAAALDAAPPFIADVPLDYISRARILYRMAACGPTGEIPLKFDAAVVDRHCADLGRAVDDYRKSWVDVAEPFLATVRPKDLPGIVVYPFGGGDLVTALATFPDATEINTISLEPSGDIRTIDTLPADQLGRELAIHRAHLERLFEKAHSRTDNLEKESKTDLPGEIVFALAGLMVHGFEPASLRYFRLQPDGALAYVTQTDLDAAAHHPIEMRNLFQNVELGFRPIGGHGPVRFVRHIAFNLDDQHLKADGSLLAYLDSRAREDPRGKVAAMTKAASHLLWNEHFSLIRDWLIAHTDWMISDSTGIPPRFAQPAGFVQDTYGTFDGPAPFGLYDKRDSDDFKRLFKSEPTRELAFRYGYPDATGHGHLIVTHRDANTADANTKTAPAVDP